MTTPRLLSAALLLALTLNAGAQITSGTLPALSFAAAGDAASGEVLSDDGNQLRLNVTPCQSSPSVVVFHKPYVTSAAGTTQCNGVTKNLVQVLQQ
jgi:hypothetical protein